MNGILIAAVVVAGIGLAAGVLLGIASIVFRVKTNEKEQKTYNLEEATEIGKQELEQELENEITNKENMLREKYKYIPKRRLCRSICDIRST